MVEQWSVLLLSHRFDDDNFLLVGELAGKYWQFVIFDGLSSPRIKDILLLIILALYGILL